MISALNRLRGLTTPPKSDYKSIVGRLESVSHLMQGIYEDPGEPFGTLDRGPVWTVRRVDPKSPRWFVPIIPLLNGPPDKNTLWLGLSEEIDQTQHWAHFDVPPKTFIGEDRETYWVEVLTPVGFLAIPIIGRTKEGSVLFPSHYWEGFEPIQIGNVSLLPLLSCEDDSPKLYFTGESWWGVTERAHLFNAHGGDLPHLSVVKEAYQGSSLVPFYWVRDVWGGSPKGFPARIPSHVTLDGAKNGLIYEVSINYYGEGLKERSYFDPRRGGLSHITISASDPLLAFFLFENLWAYWENGELLKIMKRA